MNFFNQQIELIFKKIELKFLVWALCIINLSTALFWKYSSRTMSDIANVCWPLFKSCENYLTPYLLNAMITTTIISLILLALQLRRIAFPLLTLTFLLKLSLYILNYSYSDNLHVLIFFIEIALFTFPLKSINIKILILLFIFWSGLSKLNLNWLSGLEIKNFLPTLPIKGIEWISAFVVILELVTPVILLSKLKIIFHYAWVGLLAYFTCFAFISGNYLYAIPIVLILYIVIYRNTQKRDEREKLYKSYHMPEPSRAWVLLPILGFFSINGLPNISHPIAGLDANPIQLKSRNVPSECLLKTVVIKEQTHKVLPDLYLKSSGNDFKCYPDKFKSFKQLCAKEISKSETLVIKTFYSKELTAEKFTQHFQLKYNCLTQRLIQ